eukprot:1160793-Pelagomonas_calceolata.AAC.6
MEERDYHGVSISRSINYCNKLKVSRPRPPPQGSVPRVCQVKWISKANFRNLLPLNQERYDNNT